MITLKKFLAKNNSGKIPEVKKCSTGKLMMFVEESLSLPRIFIADSLTIKKPEDLEGLIVIKAHPKQDPELGDILVVCHMSKLEDVF